VRTLIQAMPVSTLRRNTWLSWARPGALAALALASCAQPAPSPINVGSTAGQPSGGVAGAGAAGSAGAGPLGTGAAGTDMDDAGGAGAIGAADAGGSAGNAGSAGSASSGECPSGAFCESFDDGDQLDAERWESVAPNCSGTGRVAIDTMQTHRGRGSLRVEGGGGYCNHVFARPKQAVLSLPEPLYARFYLRLQRAFESSHVTFLALHDGSEDRDVRMGGQSEILMWNRESDDATLPELSPSGIALSVRPTVDRWLCVELMVSSTGMLSTWVDDEEVAGLEVAGEPTIDVDAQWQRKADWHPTLQDLKLGWESYGDTTNTLWFDDVVVAGERIGCH